MPLKDVYLARLERKQAAEAAAARPYQEAHAALKALYKEVVGDRELLDKLLAEVEFNGDELQIDPGPIFIRVSVDQAGDYRLTYEIKRHDDPKIEEIEVKSIPDIEAALAKLLVDYPRLKTDA